MDSPDYGLLSAEDSERTTCYMPASRDSCQATSGGHLRVGSPLSCQMGFFVQ